jgi:hypothetical protein
MAPNVSIVWLPSAVVICAEALKGWRFESVPASGFVLGDFSGQLAVDFVLMIVIVGEGGVDFAES